MSKRAFQILDEMNQYDTENGTQLVSISPHFVSGVKTKQGAHITMGTEESALHDIMNDKCMAVLVLIDKEEYQKREKL
ncbi:hypothetical protein C7S20_19305 [Christiangramia fulva]|uniref:Uncharacterized protein n=1 Tax=Christiangramia fulva TaxID=2126553 RepID=A0A2R3ZAC5_9FLAO|nr:hypothetical protein [Christiangramia fulva]AVR47226.1 hypothetical protein C7S20_19305 [Christiangramia fulva]